MGTPRFFIAVLSVMGLLATSIPSAATEFAPRAVMHALFFQAKISQGAITEKIPKEPCTSAGFAEAGRLNNIAVKKNDRARLIFQQRGFASGFALCAMTAKSQSDFNVLSAATLQAGSASLSAIPESLMNVAAISRGLELFSIGAWLLDSEFSTPEVKDIAKASMIQIGKTLHLRMHLNEQNKPVIG